MAGARHRYLYLRTRADGKANQTTAIKSFMKWFDEVAEGDEFFVARCNWVQCEHDKPAPFGVAEHLSLKPIEDLPEGTTSVPHVIKVDDVDSVDNGPKVK